jgi:hypothetical protein
MNRKSFFFARRLISIFTLIEKSFTTVN